MVTLSSMRQAKSDPVPPKDDKTVPVDTDPAVPQEDLPGDPDDDDTEDDDAKAKKERTNAMSERERIKAIMSSPEGQANVATANHLAFDTDLSPEAAVAILKTIPAAAVATAAPAADATAKGESKAIVDARAALDNAIAAHAPNPVIANATGKADADESDPQKKILADMKAAAVAAGVAKPDVK